MNAPERIFVSRHHIEDERIDNPAISLTAFMPDDVEYIRADLVPDNGEGDERKTPKYCNGCPLGVHVQLHCEAPIESTKGKIPGSRCPFREVDAVRETLDAAAEEIDALRTARDSPPSTPEPCKHDWKGDSDKGAVLCTKCGKEYEDTPEPERCEWEWDGGNWWPTCHDAVRGNMPRGVSHGRLTDDEICPHCHRAIKYKHPIAEGEK